MATKITNKQIDLKKTFVFNIFGTELGERLNSKLVVPYDCVVVGWKLFGISNMTTTLSILNNGSNINPTSIGLTANNFDESSSLAGWTTTLTENDILSIYISSKDITDKLVIQLVTILT